MNVVITIGGREAIPVRALPYVFPALSQPRYLIAELTHFATAVYSDNRIIIMRRNGREKDEKGFPKPKTGWLHEPVAYHLDDGIPVAIAPNDWHRIGRPITEREAKPNIPGQDYSDEIALLPPGVFVWRDECPAKGCLSPWVPGDMRAVVMEGFEHFLHQPASESAAPVVVPPQADPETDQPDTTKRVSWLVVLLESWPRIVAQHPRPTADQVMTWLKHNGPSDVIPREQPDRFALRWTDRTGSPHTVKRKTVETRLSELRKAGTIPAK